VRGGKGAANRAVGLLGAIFSYAVRRRMRSDNPVHGVMRPADGRRHRRLTDAEYEALARLPILDLSNLMAPCRVIRARGYWSQSGRVFARGRRRAEVRMMLHRRAARMLLSQNST